jgi:hypothetical protein
MLSRLTTLLLTAAIALAVPAAAGADVPYTNNVDPAHMLMVSQGSPAAMVISINEVPLGWSSSARQAIDAAEHTHTMQALHRRVHPLHVVPYVWRSTNPYWYVVFYYHGKIVADANVSRSGHVLGVWTGVQAWATYTHANFDSILTSWLVIAPASLLFMLAFFDPRRLRRLAHLDALAVLAFLASFLVLSRGILEPSVWLAYPPLIYLLARLLWIGFGRGRPTGRLAPLLSNRVLVVGLAAMLIARIVISLTGRQEIDVGYESVIGAFRILHHLPLYYNDPNHGDTYGPITYLAYVPFQLLWPWTGSLGNLHAADAAAIFFDLGTVVGLLLLGRRLRSGAAGTRLGLVLAWAWAACPFTIISLIEHTNDALVSMLTVFALVAIDTPAVSGTLLGLAAAAKFSPAGLLPLIAAPRKRGWKGAVVCGAAFTAVVAIAIYAWLPPQGFGYFWHRTISFQINRLDVFSPWALHAGLKPIQTALEALALLLVAAVAFVPRERPLWRTCALAGAVTLAIQLPATHWYYYYILWFLPFALVGSLARQSEQGAQRVTAPVASPPEPTDQETEPALAGAR